MEKVILLFSPSLFDDVINSLVNSDLSNLSPSHQWNALFLCRSAQRRTAVSVPLRDKLGFIRRRIRFLSSLFNAVLLPFSLGHHLRVFNLSIFLYLWKHFLFPLHFQRSF